MPDANKIVDGQPRCPHCGGLHYGQRFDKCPYQICTCGCHIEDHEERTHEVERGSHYCRKCNSIHDFTMKFAQGGFVPPGIPYIVGEG